ncbi:serine hydrolase domain-containing protein [Parvularcula maris]|uniref:Beta-lactamase family protein n=1 Tax=Parvularcula maris TaxID=2965077 RepID=A0A9X2RIQ0_9PROT|nr:serine hydrolase [Parvularcula maris]MCQ8186269.1 beta-lactamase family protein [Parvularcula maris]
MKTFLIAAGALAGSVTPLAAQGRWSDMSTLEEAIGKGEYGTVTSVLIMERGRTVYEGYFNGADAETLHNTRSVTKTITGMAVGAAVDEGLMTADTAAATFFTDIAPFDHPDPRKLDVTMQDLLTMSSILECDDNDNFSRGTEARMHNVEDWASFFWDLPIRGYPSWSEKPATAKYGRVFAYCSAGVEMAGWAVERASGETFQNYVQAKFFGPMGIERFEWQENGLGQAHKSGGLGLTTRGLAKFAEMQRRGGLHGRRRILSKSWTEEAVKPRVVADAERDIEYGYLWWLDSYETSNNRYTVQYMSGNGGNRVGVMPEHEVIFVITKTDYNQQDMHPKTNDLIENEIVPRLTKRR